METKKSFYGWKLLIAVGILYMCSSAFILTTGAVVNPMMLKDPNLSLNGKMLGLGFTVFVLCQGIPAPLVGQYIFKMGKKVSFITGGLMLIVGGLVMALLVKNSIMYLIGFGVILSIGSIMAGQITMQSTVNSWFSKKKALAMAIAMIMGSIGSFVAPFVVNTIIAKTGGSWQTAWFFIAALGIVVIIITLLFVVNSPADIGQVVDGEDTQPGAKVAAKPSNVFKNSVSIAYSEALKDKNYWLIAIAATAAFTSFSLTISQGMIHFTNMGLERAAVAGAIAVMGFARMFGVLSIGALGDKIEPVRIFSLYLILLAVAVFLAPIAGNNIAVAYIYYILIGIAFGGCATMTPIIVGNYFGNDSFPKNLGTVMLCTTIVSSVIPFVGGYFYDTVKSCAPAFYISGVIIIIGVIASFMIKPPKTV